MNPTFCSDASLETHLADKGLLAPDMRAQLGTLRAGRSESLSALLRRTGAVADEQLLAALSSHTGWPIETAAELRSLDLRIREAIDGLKLNAQWCRQNGFLVWTSDSELICATVDLPGRGVIELLQLKARQSGKALAMRLLRSVDLDNAYTHLMHHEAQQMVHTGDLAHLRELAEEGPTVELVNSVLSQAVSRRSSDIHIEPGESNFAVRVRVDGIMRELRTVPLDRFDATVCRIKILSQLDIAERRLPQDGRMTARIHGESFDIRVSILPGVRGESVVLRLLRQDRETFALSDLGMLADHTALFESWIKEQNGIVLVTGPTGSGKTTTLYTALDLGNDGLNKIITVEDPVEYKLQGITQLQVNADIGYTFASALRSILRHDPDVILIGEIRDQETASIAIQSALTGHLVFSTLHTNSAAGAVTRLVDMGVEAFLLASSLRGVMAQRLVRRLCPHCSEPLAEPSGQQLGLFQSVLPRMDPELAAAPALRVPVGCDICLNTGYMGRVAVYELFNVDDDIRQLILTGASETAIVAYLRAHGVRPMADDGLLKAWQGVTTAEEALSVN
ncbi:MAG: GspE/PulE family protein [Variovorax sp.]